MLFSEGFTETPNGGYQASQERRFKPNISRHALAVEERASSLMQRVTQKYCPLFDLYELIKTRSPQQNIEVFSFLSANSVGNKVNLPPAMSASLRRYL